MMMLLITCLASLQLTAGAASGSTYTSNKYVASRIDAILKEFPVGSYFSNTGKACRCHSSGCSYNNGCDCISVYKDPETGKSVSLKSVQCMGFARFAFYKIFGFLDRDNSKYYSVGSLSSSKMTVSNVKALIGKAKTGAHIRAKYNHSMILLCSDSDGITFIDSNATGRCQVSIRTITWSKFVSLYKSSGIDYVNMPKTYPGSDSTSSASADSSSASPASSSKPESSSNTESTVQEPSEEDLPDEIVTDPVKEITVNSKTESSESLYSFNYVPTNITVGDKKTELGDVDEDGKINSNDSLLVLKYKLGLISSSKINVKAADVNRDGTVDSNDAVLILRHTMGMIRSF